MEVAELVLKYLEAVVWPLVVAGLGWTLRDQLRSAFARVSRLETPAGAIEFSSDARETRTEAEELATENNREESAAGRSTEDSSSRFGVFQDAWDMADASPIGALITAWLLMLSISKRALAERDALPQRRRSVIPEPLPNEIIEALAQLGLPPRGVSVFHNLRQLRNRALHGLEVVTPAAARDFVESARFVTRQVYTLPRPDGPGRAAGPE